MRKLTGCAVLMHEREYHVRIIRHGRDAAGVYTEIESAPIQEGKTAPLSPFGPMGHPQQTADETWPFMERRVRVHRAALRKCERHREEHQE